ncbi:MAG: hypothetical protein ACI915_004552 [Gammaproteobacteria bacterium]|jgi:hypothetical protein
MKRVKSIGFRTYDASHIDVPIWGVRVHFSLLRIFAYLALLRSPVTTFRP